MAFLTADQAKVISGGTRCDQNDLFQVGIELSTHAIGGLSINDFVLAAKIDELRA